MNSGNIAPDNYFGDGKFHAVNTMQPAFQPSGNGPAAGDTSGLYADPALATTLPAQNEPTIGDRLSAKNIGWAWYAGSWDAAIADGRRPAALARQVIYAPDAPAAGPDFQPHHQPFNYYANFDPATHPVERAAHLKDYRDLIADINGRPSAPGHLLQAAGQSQSTPRLRLDCRWRRAYRRSRRETARRSAMGRTW